MRELFRWLQKANLEGHINAFHEAAVGLDIVADLTEADLKDLGLPIGDRRRFSRLLATDPPPSLNNAENTENIFLESEKSSVSERRQMTVLFCDLVGWTTLSTEHDPEDLNDALTTCRDLWARAIARYDGFVAQHLGDGLMAYFGHPHAHEDDAERAILAGVDIVASMERLQLSATRAIEKRLSIRVGIATGKVLVSKKNAGGSIEEVNVLGYTPNFASRLQGLAAPNTVVVSATTATLTRRKFQFEAINDVDIKGVEGQTEIFRVIRRLQHEQKMASYNDNDDLPLVGRLHEIGLLEDRWEAAKQGEGQVVILSGEAGIGKSRAAETLFEATKDGVALRVQLNCSSYYANSALHPIVDFVSLKAELNVADTTEVKMTKLRRFLATHKITDAPDHMLFSELLLIPGGAERLPAMSSERQKKETLRCIIRLLLHSAANRPTLIVFEDAHWADPTSLELLDALAEQIQTLNVLLVVTARDDTILRIKKLTHATCLQLNRLTRTQALEMVRNVSQGVPLTDEMMSQILQKSDGIPLFLEEMTKTIKGNIDQTGADPFVENPPSADHLSIPATLYDSLMSRLDNYPDVRETAGCAAAIGRDFSETLLSSVLGIDAAEVKQRMTRLLETGLVLRNTRHATSRFIFKHALVQDAVYESMTRSTRKDLHGRIAKTLEEMFPGIVDQSPEILAQHYQLASQTEKALEYWERAGKSAMEHSATKEAVAHLARAIALIDEQPTNPATLRRKISLLTMYGAALTSVRGYTSAETMAAYERAWKLSEEYDDASYFQEIIYGMWNSAQVGSDYERAQTLATMCLNYAEQHPDTISQLVAHNLCGVTAVLRGEHKTAGKHLAKSVALYDPELFRSLALTTGEDPGVESLSYLALNRWFVGDPASALQHAHDSMSLAREIAYKHSLIYALSMSGALLHFMRLPDQLIEITDEIISLSLEQDYPFFLEWGQNLKGWALAEQGAVDEGAALMTNRWKQGFSTMLYAKVCIKNDRPDAGLEVIDELISTQPCYAPEAHRIKGELLLLQSPTHRNKAELCFREAMSIAGRQNASSLNLKAANSLARSRRDAGAIGEMSEVILDAIKAVKADYISADLSEANALLDLCTKQTSCGSRW